MKLTREVLLLPVIQTRELYRKSKPYSVRPITCCLLSIHLSLFIVQWRHKFRCLTKEMKNPITLCYTLTWLDRNSTTFSSAICKVSKIKKSDDS